MITLILARHGETDWNKNGLLQGSSDFAKLNNVGKKQAKALGKALLKFNVDIIYSSPLKRASETAEIINKEAKFPRSVGQLSVKLVTWNTNYRISVKQAEVAGRVFALLSEVPL